MRWTHEKSQGFTLIEIAMVLVIIGLILAGILKAREIIRQAKIHQAIQESRVWQAAYLSYIDRFGQKPGDDNTQADRWPDMINGNSDGYIAGTTCSGDHEESCLAIRALMHAGYIEGDGSIPQPKPKLALGGEAHLFSYTVNGKTGVWLLHNGSVPKDMLQEMDRKFDDGLCYSGTMIAYNYWHNFYCNATTGDYAVDHGYRIRLE